LFKYSGESERQSLSPARRAAAALESLTSSCCSGCWWRRPALAAGWDEFDAGAGAVLCGLRIGLAEFREQRAIVRTEDVLVEQPEQDTVKFGVWVFLVMFQRQGSGDDLAPGIGFALGLFVAGFERS
jgi:hypothetical protein